MLSDEDRNRVQSATLITGNEETGRGQSVFIGNYMVLSAAHCFQWDASGGIVLGDYVIYDLETPHGANLKASPMFIDPVSDLVVLGPCDDQALSDWHWAFIEWCDHTEPVEIGPPLPVRSLSSSLSEPFTPDEPTPVPCHVWTHTKEWITGSVVRLGFGPQPFMVLQSDDNILSGTSGGPIVDDLGRLLGVVSNSGGSEGVFRQGSVAIPRLALPVWIVQELDTG